VTFYGYNHESPEWVTVFDDANYTITYTTTSGEHVRIVKPMRKPKEPELQAGDSSALDAFLGGFTSAQK